MKKHTRHEHGPAFKRDIAVAFAQYSTGQAWLTMREVTLSEDVSQYPL